MWFIVCIEKVNFYIFWKKSIFDHIGPIWSFLVKKWTFDFLTKIIIFDIVSFPYIIF